MGTKLSQRPCAPRSRPGRPGPKAAAHGRESRLRVGSCLERHRFVPWTSGPSENLSDPSFFFLSSRADSAATQVAHNHARALAALDPQAHRPGDGRARWSDVEMIVLSRELHRQRQATQAPLGDSFLFEYAPSYLSSTKTVRCSLGFPASSFRADISHRLRPENLRLSSALGIN